MRKNGKSTKQVNKSIKGKAKPAAPKSAAKQTAAPESKGIGRQGQIREVANVKVFQRKLAPVSEFLKKFKLVRLTTERGAVACPRGPRAGLLSRRAMIESVLATATPQKPIRLSELNALLAPFGVAGVGGEHFSAMLAKRVIAPADGGGYYATRNASRGKPSKN